MFEKIQEHKELIEELCPTFVFDKKTMPTGDDILWYNDQFLPAIFEYVVIFNRIEDISVYKTNHLIAIHTKEYRDYLEVKKALRVVLNKRTRFFKEEKPYGSKNI